MYTVYSLYTTYANYLDNYYVRDYSTFITFLLENSADVHKQERVNLGIIDGVNIRNNLKGNYREYNCLIVEDEEGNRDLYKITGKTFVRRDIWNIEARLDVFSKHYAAVLTADVLVQRLGYKDWSTFSPILFNDEGFTLSEVKKEQHGITFCGGDLVNNSDYIIGDDIKLCGYLLIFAKDALQSDLQDTTLSTTTYTPDPDYEVDDITEWDAYKYAYSLTIFSCKLVTNDGSNQIKFWWYVNEEIEVNNKTYRWESAYTPISLSCTNGLLGDYSVGGTYTITSTIEPSATVENYLNEYADIFPCDVYTNPSQTKTNTWGTPIWINMCIYMWSVAYDKYDSYLKRRHNGGYLNASSNYYKNYNGKIVLDKKTGRYYQITMTEDTEPVYFSIDAQDDISKLVWGSDYMSKSPQPYGKVQIEVTPTSAYKWSFTEVFPSITTKETITMKAKMNTIDEGNPVIFIPYIETNLPVYVNLTDGTSLEYKQTNILQIIRKMQLQYSGDSAVLLDVQKVPFILLPNTSSSITPSVRIENNAVYLDGFQAENITEYYEIDKTSEYVNLIRYALPYAQNIITTDTAQISISDYKLEQMNTYLLRSPSGSSTEDFSPVKNKGVNGWILKYNIRPYESMLQLQPIYNGYYGTNFTDTRGVVMLEDISLTEYSSEWETYVRQNINYVNSFESNINYEQSQLSLQQNYEKESFKIERIASGLNAAISWATSGATAVGQAAIGDLGKAVGSANEANVAIASEAVNAATSKKQLNLQLQYETDQLAIEQAEERKQWQYSLGNIQALPLNTDKTCGIYNSNYGVFYYEKYEPTDYEMYVYENYLKLFGITIGQPVPLTQFEFDYIEGNVIKYNQEITIEEYKELNEELLEGRRLYSYVTKE